MQENKRHKPSLGYWEWGGCGDWCKERKGATFTGMTDKVGGLFLLKALCGFALFLFFLSDQQKNSKNKL